MRPTITIVRAVGVAFVRRTLRPIMFFGIAILVALLGFGGWLTTQSAWWWVLEVVFTIGGVVFTLLLLAVFALVRGVDPGLSKAQQQATNAFVDKLERVA